MLLRFEVDIAKKLLKDEILINNNLTTQLGVEKWKK